ncbi:MAG: transaldolase, partial [Gemmataceae bacterium]|nr:transaldolase [Gemmataceae bacterium]
RIWKKNNEFWAGKKLPLKQEMIFASTGTKNKEDKPWKYVAAFAGSDIQTNPPATNKAVHESSESFTRRVDELPAAEVLADIDAKVDIALLEKTLMEEGLKKFADPQRALIALVASKRKT